MVQKCQMLIWWLAIAGYEHCRKAKVKGWTLRRLIDPSIYWWKLVSLFADHAEVSEKYMKACSKAKEFSKVGLLSFTGFNKKLIWDKAWYDDIVAMPFEYTWIDCPKDYDPILKTQYGDYMKFVKGGQIHTMAIFDPETPFHIKLKEA